MATASPRTTRTPEKEQAILEQLRLTGRVTIACRAARIPRMTYYSWRSLDDAFRAASDAARREGIDALLDDVENALIARAKKIDTTAAIFLLKSHRRETYGDKIAHDHAGTITHRHRDLSHFTDAEIEAMSAVAERVKAERS